IAISGQLPTMQRTFVMFHELGHFLMHSVGQETVASFSGFCPESREEQEADAFAYCALLPLSLLKSREPEELAELYGSSFLMARLDVYERYKV
ncbi:MAG TPA: ImmA/IrrE family metallo-endopeptidase, partial [Pyrinomonadaceae bacterium]|nr:ImmA/IrrE family metallo-endopeptidase [Pyrinomonadaceae bacterium]